MRPWPPHAKSSGQQDLCKPRIIRRVARLAPKEDMTKDEVGEEMFAWSAKKVRAGFAVATVRAARLPGLC